MIGRTLGHYEIIEPLGAGGMGEVYRAHDTILKRDVALKVLPEELSADGERLARLEREAQLLAALNHPNIATIHGLEEAQAEDGTSARFLVLELIEGESLAETLSCGRIEVDMALGIARQIAEALEAAHAKGIIHRDLKPGNVLITPDGQAKVLDFGLAKSDRAEGAGPGESPDPTESPTVAAASMAGVILGTAAYMSPEQARGKPLDKRTDIWSFGGVLYEMLTWRIRDLLQQCLEKEPRDRLRDVGDARITLDRVLSDPSEEPAGFPPGAAPPIRTSRSVVVGALVVAVVCLMIAAWSVFVRATAVPPAPSRLVINLEQNQSLGVTEQSSLAVSPDGTSLVYVATSAGRRMLHLRRVNQFGSSPIPGTEGALSPFFSPDGEWVGFFAENQLIKIALAGGEAETISRVVAAPAGATWLPDDTIIFATGFTPSGLYLVSATGGEPEVLTSPNRTAGEYAHVWPRYLPGGRDILFTLVGEDGEFYIALLSLRTREWRTVMRGGAKAVYVPSGHLVYGQREQLVAVPFDLQRGELSGSPVTVIDDVWKPHPTGAAHFDTSQAGALYYAPVEEQFVGTLGWVDREGQSTPLPFGRGLFGDIRLSPDGTRAALATTATTQAVGQMWIYDLERGGRTHLAPSALNGMPVWHPDGEWITFSLWRGGASGLYRQRVDRSGEMEPLLTSEHPLWPLSFSPDGRLLAYYEVNPDTGRDIWVLPMEGDRTPIPFLVTESNERSPVFSPNGRWIAYASNESGRDEVYVRPYPPGTGGQILISTDGGREPVWARDGRELFYRSGNRLMAVPVEIESAENPVSCSRGDSLLALAA